MNFDKLANIGKEEKPAEEPENNGNNNQTPPAEEKPAEEVVEEKPEPEPIDMGLFTITPPKEKTEPEEWTPEKFFETVKKQYGFEVKSFDDALGKFGEYRDTKTKLDETETEANRYKELIGVMPADLKAVFADALEGRDYHQTMKNLVDSNVDYNKEATSYSKDKLIKMYNSDMTDEEFEDMDERTKDRLYNASVKAYNSDRSQYINRAQEFDNNQKESAKLVLNSIDKSMAKLKEVFPDLKKDKLDNINNKMKTNWAASMFDEKGTWREDAAVRIALAEYGLDVINGMRAQLEKEMARQVKLAESKAKEELVKEKLNDTPPKNPTASNPEDISAAAKAAVPWLKKK